MAGGKTLASAGFAAACVLLLALSASAQTRRSSVGAFAPDDQRAVLLMTYETIVWREDAPPTFRWRSLELTPSDPAGLHVFNLRNESRFFDVRSVNMALRRAGRRDLLSGGRPFAAVLPAGDYVLVDAEFTLDTDKPGESVRVTDGANEFALLVRLEPGVVNFIGDYRLGEPTITHCDLDEGVRAHGFQPEGGEIYCLTQATRPSGSSHWAQRQLKIPVPNPAEAERSREDIETRLRTYLQIFHPEITAPIRFVEPRYVSYWFDNKTQTWRVTPRLLAQ
jgi:hypothetical protein